MALAKLADRIVVMEQRQVAEEGSHGHLMELGEFTTPCLRGKPTVIFREGVST